MIAHITRHLLSTWTPIHPPNRQPKSRCPTQPQPWPASRPSLSCPLYAPPRSQDSASSSNLCDQILAIGFILVILSSALYHNFLTLLVVATYVLAPVPNWICSKAQSNDDFMDSGSNSIVELGRFLTGFFVVMGIGTLDLAVLWRDMWAGQDDCAKQGREGMIEELTLTYIRSSSHCAGPHRTDPRRGHGHEHYWRSAHLRHHHQLHHVLPRAGRVLVASGVFCGNL